MIEIRSDFEGANIKVLSVTQDEVLLDTELRDTVGDWFFWCFKVIGAEGKNLRFRFANNFRVGYYGAAVSHDFMNWHWQYSTPHQCFNEFEYSFGKDEKEVYFAHDMVYRPRRLTEFLKKLSINVKELCISEKGRSVPYITFGKGQEAIILTARHHACESTGNYVLEGVIEELTKSLSDSFKIICIPFVDYDGVTDGDQGKSRNGHDHNLDYAVNEPPRYQSVAAIRKLSKTEKIRFAFDFHSPWHLGGSNDTVFIPIKLYDALPRIKRFSRIFEEVSRLSGLPHFAENDILPDVDWNKADAPSFATFWGKHGAELSFTIETPYFNASGVPFSPENAIDTGKNFIKALIKYLNIAD